MRKKNPQVPAPRWHGRGNDLRPRAVGDLHPDSAQSGLQEITTVRGPVIWGQGNAQDGVDQAAPGRRKLS